MNVFNKAKKNTLCSVLFQLVTISMGILIPKLTIDGYGSEINGLLSSATQLLAYLLLFESGVSAVAMHSLYKYVAKNDRKSINEVLSAVDKEYKKIGFYYLLSLLFISFTYAFLINSKISKIAVFLVIFFSGLGNVVSFFFQGKYLILLETEGKNYIKTNLQTIISVLSHLIKVYMLYLKIDIALVIIASFLISMIQTIYIKLYIIKHYSWINLKCVANYEALNQNKDALIHQIAGLIFSNIDTLLLTVFCGLKIVSVYSLYKMIISYIATFISIPLNSCSFAMGQAYNTDKASFIKYQDILEVCFATITYSLFTVTFFMIIPFVIQYTSKVNDVSYVNKTVAFLFVIMELLNLSRQPMLNVIRYAGKFKDTVCQTIIETVINVACSVIFVRKIGIYGVIVGTIIALLYRTIDIIVFSNNKLLNRSGLKTFSIYVLNIVLMIICSVLLNKINIKISSIIDFLLIGVMVTPTIVVIFILINGLIFTKERKELYKLIRIKHGIGNSD